MEEIALGTANNWCRGAIVWNLMLDSDLGPVSPSDGSCKTCYGAVDIDNTNYSKIVRNSHYYLIGHMSSVVKPGAVRSEQPVTQPTESPTPPSRIRTVPMHSYWQTTMQMPSESP